MTSDLFPLIRQSLASHSLFGYVRKLEVLPTGLDSLEPLVGAAALVWTGACQTTPVETTTSGRANFRDHS